MKFKTIILIILFFSMISFNGCGRKDAPVKPSQTIPKN